MGGVYDSGANLNLEATLRARTPNAIVATVVEPSLRSRFDSASPAWLSAKHTQSVAEVIKAVREEPVNAILISPGYIKRSQIRGVTKLVRGFPGIPTVALVSSHDAVSSERLLELGGSGVRQMVDVTSRTGWGQLRELLADPICPTASAILEKIAPYLEGAAEDFTYFVEILARISPSTTTVRSLCRHLKVRPSTLMSRFFRAGIPSPRQYLSGVRMIHAVALLTESRLSIADVAYRMEYSSPQSFGRHVRNSMGITAGELRDSGDVDRLLNDYISNFIAPFRSRFRTFHPLESGVTFGHT